MMAKAVKKAASSPKKKSTGGGSKERNTLAKELGSLIPKLDEEGLAFLVKQAHVHLYNMQVDALNKTMIKDEARQKTAPKRKVQLADSDFLDIKLSDSGTSYFLRYSNQWISFAKNEITDIVKIALGDDSDLEIRERLFNWLSRERNDVLYTASIANKFDDRLVSLLTLLRENFKLKKNRKRTS
jgi:hypothetical protein